MTILVVFIQYQNMSAKSGKRGTPAKNEQLTLATELLYNSGCQPNWTRLPREMKRALCKIMRKSYNNIHDPKFYTDLRSLWTNHNEYRMSQVKTTEVVSCAVCLDTYKLDGKDKVTTLMCGHQFCSPCIFRHMLGQIEMNSRRRISVCAPCPMCRANVFEQNTCLTRTTVNATANGTVNAAANAAAIEAQRIEQCRQRRRDERRAKHQHRREQKESGTIVNTR
jgi:hypothetical protein